MLLYRLIDLTQAQVVVPKPRTKSEAGDSSTAPLPLPSSYSKPSIMRSRSLDNIYEENLRDDSFNRPLAYPAKAGATNCEQLHQLMNKRPSIDRYKSMFISIRFIIEGSCICVHH